MNIAKVTGRSAKSRLITQDLVSNFEGTVDEALAKFFPVGAWLESGDSPYELAVYSAQDDDLGCIDLSADEARAYLADKHGLQRAKAILGEFERDFHDTYVRPFI